MRSIYQLLLVFLLASCASPPLPQPGLPLPSPAIPEQPIPNASKSWPFRLAAGTFAYRISRSAAIENVSDSGRREVSTNSTYESLALQPLGDTVRFTSTVDTFSTAIQRAIGPVQPVQLPLRITGLLVGDSLTFADSLTARCSPAVTSVITDLYNLLPHFPAMLSPGLSWKDSTDITGCQASIPIRSRVDQTFQAIGESTRDEVSVLVVQRVDTIHAEGEGAQQQHRVQLKANGVGNATYYIDTNSGRIVYMTIDQEVNLAITASGTTSYFRQSAKESFTLVR